MENITYDDFAKLELRVAQIKAAEPVEGSEKLVRLELDCGPDIGERQILAGIIKRYSPEELVGRRIVMIANLEPRKLMGLESQGMLLAADSENGPVLLDPGDAMPGATIK
jgi:methionine--tRNA ligase beta chain